MGSNEAKGKGFRKSTDADPAGSQKILEFCKKRTFRQISKVIFNETDSFSIEPKTSITGGRSMMLFFDA